MMRPLLAAFLLCTLMASPAGAHDLRREVEENARAVSVRLFYTDGNAFSFESYEIYRSGEDIPFQVGRTDALGRIVFLPDRPSTWRIKAFSQEGHGVDFSVTTATGGTIEKSDRPVIERYTRVITGVALIFGLFGVIELVTVRRRRT